jgi:protein N-lysine methyltransferase METTL21A
MGSDEERDFLNFSEDLVQLPSIKSAGISEVGFDSLLPEPLKLHEDLKEGCGGQLWPAGIALAKYLLRQHKETMKGKTMFVLLSRQLPFQSSLTSLS